MECPACCKQMTALMDQELSSLEAQPVRQHLRECLKCRSEYDSLYFSYKLVDRVSEDGLQAPRWAPIENRIQKPTPNWTDSLWKLFPGGWVPVAASAAVVLTCALVLMPSSSGPDAETARLFASFMSQREQDDELLETVWGLVDEGDLPNPFTLVSSDQIENPFQSE